MAKLHCRLAVVFFILSIFSYVHDVSALYKQSTDMFSKPKTSQTQEQRDPSFTVKLYSRDSLGLSPFKNNRDSTLARLKRDAARVNFISRKLNPVNEGNVSGSPTDLASPLISGESQHSYEYFARFGIGTPAKQFYTAIDTGTDITWIQCLCDQKLKDSCYKQTDPFFEPSKSSSYKPLSCDAPKCQELPGLYHESCTASAECNYRVPYVDKSFSVGGLATETFRSGSSVVDDVAIGCGHNNQGKFNGSAGILALGIGSLSFPSQIKAKSFSYCLVNYKSTRAHSTLSFGAPIPSDAIRIPFLHVLNTYYALSLTAISVGERKFSMYKAYGARGLPLAVDSGTFLTYLPLSQYSAIREEFVKGVHLPSVDLGNNLECFKTTSAATESLPTIKFHFDAKTLVLPTKTYLMPEYDNSACFTFAPILPDNNIPFGILGSQQQQETKVTLDLANSLIGFSENKC